MNVVARYKYPNGFTVHYLGDGFTLQTGAALDDGSFIAVAGRAAGTQACEGKTADAAFAKALAQIVEWRAV